MGVSFFCKNRCDLSSDVKFRQNLRFMIKTDQARVNIIR